MTPVEEVMIRYRCGYCMALPGQRCINLRSGRAAQSLHVDRYNRAVIAGALQLGEVQG